MARSRPTGGRQVARRPRTWARARVSLSGITNGTPAQQDLMSDLEAVGTGPAPWGVTVGPIILSGVTVRTTTAGEVFPIVVAGVRTASRSIEAVDHDPTEDTMLDWMLWGGFAAPPAVNTNHIFGSDPPARSGSMRKLQEAHEALWIVAGTDAATGVFSLQCWASILVIH